VAAFSKVPLQWLSQNKPGGTSFNPLLIFGGVGLGKTIAHAIGEKLKINTRKNSFVHFS
jgi:chromosomal replication initiator protein